MHLKMDERDLPFQQREILLYLSISRKEGRKEILLMIATTKVNGHANVLSEQINRSQLYRGKL